jgi:gliding motility-associated-like protein
MVDLSKASNSRNNYANYEYSWYASLDSIGAIIGTDTLLAGLSEGDYSIKVRDITTNCKATAFFIVPDQGPQFLPQLALSSAPVYNCLTPDGTVMSREIGYNRDSEYPFHATINFTSELYLGANPDTSVPGIVMPKADNSGAIPPPNLNWATRNIDIGIYTVKLTDVNTGCSVTDTISIMDGRTAPVVVIVEENPLINCDVNRPNGQLSSTADGGRIVGYAFEWHAGLDATTPVLDNNNKLIGATAGFYTVRVTNNETGCSKDELGLITDGTVLPPTPTGVLVQHRENCEIPDGWVAATVGGITLNYDFDWYDGMDVTGSANFTGTDYMDRDIGVYSVIAMDLTTGCRSLPDTVEVKDRTVIPELFFQTTPSYCDELPGGFGGNGSITLQLKPAGVLSDSVVWIATETGSSYIGSYVAGVLPGEYTAYVKTVEECAAEGSTIVPTEILEYNLVTSNGDGANDAFKIDCISRFPDNNVKIFNRAGVLVYEADGYDNADVVFQGKGTKGVYTTGNDLPVGTYFFIIDKKDGSKPKTGYLELVK